MARGQPWVTSYPGVPPQPPQSCPRPGLSLTYLPPSPRAATSWAQQVWDGRQLGGKKGKMSSYLGLGRGGAVTHKLGQSPHQSPSRLPCDPCRSDCPQVPPAQRGLLGLLGFSLPSGRPRPRGAFLEVGLRSGLGKLDL